nr:PSII 47 kDa protein, chloroplastic [Tanacetum cinerariifolium]
MGLPRYHFHIVVFNDPRRLLALHIMHRALVFGWVGLTTLYELVVFDPFDHVLNPIWRQSVACLGFGAFHVTGLYGLGIWVSNPYGLKGKVQSVNPSWGVVGFDPFVSRRLASHHIATGTLGCGGVWIGVRGCCEAGGGGGVGWWADEGCGGSGCEDEAGWATGDGETGRGVELVAVTTKATVVGWVAKEDAWCGPRLKLVGGVGRGENVKDMRGHERAQCNWACVDFLSMVRIMDKLCRFIEIMKMVKLHRKS